MVKKYGSPPDQVTKIRIILNNPNPSKSSHLRPNGFNNSADEYTFFYEIRSAYGFECPDETIRSVCAINYYWECLSIIRNELGITANEIASAAFLVASAIDHTDETFETVFAESVLIEIEDHMEICRRGWQQ